MEFPNRDPTPSISTLPPSPSLSDLVACLFYPAFSFSSLLSHRSDARGKSQEYYIDRLSPALSSESPSPAASEYHRSSRFNNFLPRPFFSSLFLKSFSPSLLIFCMHLLCFYLGLVRFHYISLHSNSPCSPKSKSNESRIKGNQPVHCSILSWLPPSI